MESLYHAARTRAPEARDAFLVEACADDEPLRREVESLLAQSVSADGVFDGPALAFAARMLNQPGAGSLVGRRLDIYQVLAPLGAGGMGEVYRARDTRLGRDVALKVLPREFTADSERLVRFEREARALAAVNHPHIAAIYGVQDIEPATGPGQPGSVRALVLELVEGETLAERIRKRGGDRGSAGLPLADTLALARQIAEALDAAHEKGIVHRDLKPANIKITPEGVVKVLDFGLAKLASPVESGDISAANAPTITRAATREGRVVGTPAYMSPEQARGQAVDKRADVWAFGCVFYEMLTGQAAFARETITGTLAAVLEREPDWDALPGTLHPRLRSLLERCLEKNARNRYQGIGDARVDIEQVIAEPRGNLATHDKGRPSVTFRVWPLLAVAAVLGALVAAGVAWTLRPNSHAVTARLTHVLPDGPVFFGSERHPLLAVAPDGSSIVYAASNQLLVRPLNEFEAKPIRGTEGRVSTPFFSPDGRSVGYWDAGDEWLKRVDIGGGTPILLDRAPLVRGASWSRDGNILYAKPDGIWSVSAESGQPHRVIPVGRGLVHGPQLLPDTRSVLFTRLVNQTGRSWEGAEVVVHDLVNHDEQVLFQGEDARYIPTGHVIYALDTTLFAAPFDPAVRRITGRGVPVVEDVRREVSVPGNTSAANYGVTDDGTLVYLHGPAERFPIVPRDLVMVDHEGVPRAITEERRDYWRPRISPDGTRVAVEVFDGNARHLWVVNVATGVSTQVTFTGFLDDFPVWTRDGRSIVFASVVEGVRGLFRKQFDGGGDAEALGVTGQVVPTDMSRENTLLYSVGDQTSERAIWTVSLSDRKAVEILATPALEHQARFSPDGRWLAYVSNAMGHDEVYIRPYPIVKGTERRVSEGGGQGPVWAPDGSALYYRGPQALMVAPTPLGPGFVPGRPRALFSHERFRFSGNASAFDIHPDGKRFVMVTMGNPPAPPRNQINVVFNWFEELKRRVPAGS